MARRQLGLYLLCAWLLGGCAAPGASLRQNHEATNTVDLGPTWYADSLTPDWFTKTFPLPQTWNSKVVWLTLETPEEPMDIWLNGDFLGFSRGGPFQTMIHPSLQPGMNTLTLRSVKSLAGLEILGPSARNALLRAPVTLRASEDISLIALEATPAAHAIQEKAEVSLEMQLVHPGSRVSQFDVQVAVVPGNFKNSATIQRTFSWTLGPGTHQRAVPLTLNHPALAWPWDFNEKHSFQVSVEIHHQGKLLDRRQTSFSFGSVQFDPAARIWMINGKRVYPKPQDLRASGASHPNPKVQGILGR